jgi:hypothetical protein
VAAGIGFVLLYYLPFALVDWTRAYRIKRRSAPSRSM